jgi:hypothetical protein
MRNFLGGAICPRCLKPINYRRSDTEIVCEACTFSIPAVYLREVRKTPPVFVQLIGLTSVGKTTFLDMLRIQLYRMTKMWPDAFAIPATEEEMEYRRILLADRPDGILAPATTKQSIEQNNVHIIQLMNMERWNSHFLVLMDFSGEYFGSLYIPINEIPFFCQVPVTIMLLSLPDMKNEKKTMEEVLYSYIRTLENQRVNLARRQLIIVFNKADRIGTLPQEVKDYLQHDTLYQQLRDQPWIPDMSKKQFSRYLSKMEDISTILGQWVLSVDGGAGMWAMLRNKRIEVRFCAMSATGHQLNPAFPQKPLPRRIFDPFFWVMEYYNKHW